MLMQTGDMVSGAVALVAGESIAGMELVELYHDAVTGDLGDNRGAGDGEAQFIAPDYRLL
jgi:hypothetical protein